MSKWVEIDSILHSLENIRTSGMGKRRSLDMLKELIINNSKEIVHCKECAWRDMWECPMSDKDRPEDDYYCGDGEYCKKHGAYFKYK